MEKDRTKQPTPLILHGHFYQPPRENPRTGIIHKQLSASPYSDWNELITTDCYRANCHSRYLTGDGSVLSLTNNYEWISHNFGPTLLSWMEANHKRTYELIISADRLSVQRLGHGNAIAQAYNHTILPLANRRDAMTQILWGLDDFNRRYGRHSEGIWLPETAINPMVIDLLSEAGVKFVILSPWQCRSIEGTANRQVMLGGRPAPYDRPFILEGERGGTISAFFYNPQLAEGISFGHYLRDADQLYRRLVTIKAQEQPKMLHTATDGEIYGHHEPYGDMALAALIKKVADGNDFTFTNYGAYLQAHPPTERAQLHEGEDARGTSWSCFHGVSRWYKDCGCHTGGEEGWNQRWRTPLRSAFDQMGEKLDTLFTEEVKRLLGDDFDPWAMLSRFSPVASGLISMEEFLQPYSEDQKVITHLAHLLLSQLYKHYSFTSCGWFFNDLAGLEPRQNITYALMALDCVRPVTDEGPLNALLSTLALAKSNRRQDGNGETLAREELASLSGEAEAALFFALDHRLSSTNERRPSYGHFTLLNLDTHAADVLLLTLKNTNSLNRYHCRVQRTESDRLGFSYTLHFDEGKEAIAVDVGDIPLRMRDELFDRIEERFCTTDADSAKRLSRTIRHFTTLARTSLYYSMGSLHQELVGATLTTFRGLFYRPMGLQWWELEEEYSILVDFLLTFGKQAERDTLKRTFDSHIVAIARQIDRDGLTAEMIKRVSGLLALVRTRGFEPELKSLQERVYPYLVGTRRWEGTGDLITDFARQLNFSITVNPGLSDS
jgi:hypothetical protein